MHVLCFGKRKWLEKHAHFVFQEHFEAFHEEQASATHGIIILNALSKKTDIKRE